MEVKMDHQVKTWPDFIELFDRRMRKRDPFGFFRTKGPFKSEERKPYNP